MAADEGFRDRVLARLAPLPGVSSRSMFGGFGIFSEQGMFGLISGSDLFFKVDESNLAEYEKAGSKKHGPMPYYKVPEAVLEDVPQLLSWARTSIAVAERAPKKKKG